MLNKGDKIGLICCSNGKEWKERPQIEKLINLLRDEFQLQSILAPTLFQKKTQSLVEHPEKEPKH